MACDRRRTAADRTPDLRMGAGSCRNRRPSSDRSEHGMSVIVVGVDHSSGAKAALRFGLEEARLRGATLRAVHALLFGYIGAVGFESSFPVLGGELDEL